MSEDIHLILSDLKKRLKSKYKTNLKSIVLFGSHASGKANPDSDYDILVILESEVDWLVERAVSDECFETDLKYGVFIDLHVLSESDLKKPRGRQPVFLNAIANGIYA